MSPGKVLPKGFYERSPEVVARELLGKRLVRLIDGERLEGVIVETEAYHGGGDPASRAFHGRKEYNAGMWEEAGRLFVYNVHKYWMLNVISHLPGGVGGVLFRAIEPTAGVEAMMRRRPVGDVRELTSGPGKLGVALGVTRELSGIPATDAGAPVHILDAPPAPAYATSHRIGVTRDLPEELRFYVPGNRFVSH
jgi:DNA-3-methyladenine glycosylase